MDSTGDTTLELERPEAEAKFAEIRAAGNLAFAVDAPGKGRMLTTLEPGVEEVIVHRPLQGG